MEGREWGVESGEWRVGNGESGAGNGKFQVFVKKRGVLSTSLLNRNDELSIIGDSLSTGQP